MKAGTVLLLGAGFSRAISPHAPLTDELGNLAVSRLPPGAAPPSSFRRGYFEAWLSRLAEDQPDLGLSQNQQNRSYFTLVTQAIHDIFIERELQVPLRKHHSGSSLS